MPRKNPEKHKENQAKAAKKHYEANKELIKKRAMAYKAEQKIRLKAMVDDLKDNPCVDCGVEYPGEPYLLDYDHVRGEKIQSISKAITLAWSVERVLKEIDKCELVCAICHRRRTHTRSVAVTSPGG